MGFRFQRRIRIGRGVRINISKSGVGASIGRPGLRVGVDAKRRKYFSLGLPGTGLSYRSFFGQPVGPQTIRAIVLVSVTLAGVAILIFVVLALRG